jgi:hypothetical protein
VGALYAKDGLGHLRKKDVVAAHGWRIERTKREHKPSNRPSVFHRHGRDSSGLRAYAADNTADSKAGLREEAMTQDVLGALWFITLLIGVYGMAAGGLCLWRRGD